MKNMKRFAFFCSVFLAIRASGQISTSPVYSVPVPDSLKPYATYPIAPPQIIKTSSQILITYQLPPELVGENFPDVTLQGSLNSYSSAGPFQLSGPLGSAACSRGPQPTDMTTCQIKFNPLQIDQNSVTKVVLTRSTNSSAINPRLEIARLFAADPVGVLKY